MASSPRPRLPREFLTDHNHGQTFSAIVLVDQPSIEQCNTKRFKIVRANNAMRSNRNFIWGSLAAALNIEDCVERNFSLKRNVCCDSGCDHSGRLRMRSSARSPNATRARYCEVF